KIIVGVQILGRLAPGTFDFGLLHLWRDSSDHTGRDVILQIENILKGSIETIRPDVGSGCSINELSCDPHALPAPAHAALQYVAYTKLSTHLLHINGTAFVREA